MRVVNLSSRPFVNERPVVRLSMVLWVLGAALAAYNVYSYSTYWLDSEEIRGEVADLKAKIGKQDKDLTDLSRRASAIDIEGLNDHAFFLNNLIRYRTFPWSRLFGDLEEVLPKNVRLVSVHPVVERQQDVDRTRRRKPRRSRRSSDEEASVPVAAPRPDNTQEIPMTLAGYAKSDEEILDFVDILFAHPSFQDPDFKRESLNEDTGEVAFDIGVVYLLEITKPEAGASDQIAEAEQAPPSPPGERSEEASPDERPEEAPPADEAETASIVRTFDGQGEEEEEPPSALPDPSGGAAAPEVILLEDDPEEGELENLRRRAPPPPSSGAGRPGAGRRDVRAAPPAAGTGRDPSGTRLGTVPTLVLPPGSAHRAAGAPSDPRRINPTRLDPPPPANASQGEGFDAEPPTRVRPRFVEPNASGTATIFPGEGR